MINLKYKKLLKFAKYLKIFSKEIIFMFLAIVLNQVCSLILPMFMSRLVDVGIRRNGIEDFSSKIFLSEQEILSIQSNYIIKTGLLMLGVTLTIVFISIYINCKMAKISSGISSALRTDIFHKVMDLPYECIDKFSPSSLITRLTNDVEHVQALILMFAQMIIPPIVMIGGIIMALNTGFSMMWITILGSMVSGSLIFLCFKILMPHLKIVQKLEDKFNLMVKEQLTGIVTIRGFNNQKFEEKRFEELNSKFANISLFINKISSFISPVLTVSMNVLTALALWIGANKINDRSMELGQVIAFMQYTVMIIGAFVMISFMVSMIPRFMVSVERVSEILYFPNDYKNIRNLKKLSKKFESNIEFENVSFKYAGASEYVLKNISFSLNFIGTIGIIGTTGSGKSTLLKLMLGLYSPTSGNIKIGENNINELDRTSINNSISYVSQKDSLFSGTVSSNLRISNPEVTDEELLEVLKIVQLEEFINKKGLNFKILQSGSNVSGGQKQRLCLARSLVKKSKIYILDDVFSGLDFKTEHNLKNSLINYLKESQIIFVSQRIGTVKDANKIIVIDQGEIVGMGNHQELIQKCEVYKRMVILQLGRIF